MKEFVYKALLAGKRRYNVGIIDYVLMSNHIHFIAIIDDLTQFENFMRTTNSAIAKEINRVHEKRSSAIEDRYKSPVIEDEAYLLNTINYIWQNPLRAGMVGGRNLGDYEFSSLFRRLRGLNDPLCDSYDMLKGYFGSITDGTRSEQDFARRLLDAGMKDREDLLPEIYEHLHSVGTDDYRKIRRKRENISFFQLQPP